MVLSKIQNLFNALDTKQANCEKHGEYTAKLFKFPSNPDPVWSGCHECEQEKIKQEDRQIAIANQKAQEQMRVNAIMGRAAIPKRFLDRNLSNFKVLNEGQQKALNAATRYAKEWESNFNDGRCLIMLGKPGTGKTHLAIGIAREIMETGYTAMFCRAHEAISTITETYSRDSAKTERQALDEFRKPDLLIIDEVGRQRGTDNERMMLFEIINRRYDDEKPTLLISNLNIEGLRGYIDAATEDRLRERDGRVITFDWPSMRGQL